MNRYLLGGAVILAGAAAVPAIIDSTKLLNIESRLIEQCEEYGSQQPPRPSLDNRLAQFEFKNLVGDTPQYEGMDYLWVAYNSKSTNQDRGTLEVKKEITEFLKTSEFDFVEFYIIANGRQRSKPVAIVQKNGDMARVFYDRLELGLSGGFLYWVGCYPDWNIEQLIKLSAGVDKIMDAFKTGEINIPNAP